MNCGAWGPPLVRAIIAARPLQLQRRRPSRPLSSLGRNYKHRAARIGAATFSVLRDSVRQRGLGTLWRGLAPTLWRDVPFSGLYWRGFEASKVLTPTWYRTAEDPSLFDAAVGRRGLGAGALAAPLTTPADVAKTRLQVAAYDVPGSSVPRAPRALPRSIARTRGPLHCSPGAGPALVEGRAGLRHHDRLSGAPRRRSGRSGDHHACAAVPGRDDLPFQGGELRRSARRT